MLQAGIISIPEISPFHSAPWLWYRFAGDNHDTGWNFFSSPDTLSYPVNPACDTGLLLNAWNLFTRPHFSMFSGSHFCLLLFICDLSMGSQRVWQNHISGDQSNNQDWSVLRNQRPREICCCSGEKSTVVGWTNHGRWQATNPTWWPAQILTCQLIRTNIAGSNNISSENPK